MNIEDLRKLKETLEKTERYLPISRLYYKNNVIGLPVSPNEIIAQENTDEVVKKCEDLIEKSVRLLVGNNINFNHLEITSEFGLFCNPEYLHQFKKLSYVEDPEIDYTSENLTAFYEKLKTQVFPHYVPVSFKFNYYNTSDADGHCVENFALDAGLEPEEVFNLGEVGGIVHWERFVEKMKALGYNVSFYDQDTDVTFDDYVDAVINAGDDTEIDISAEFGRTHKM